MGARELLLLLIISHCDGDFLKDLEKMDIDSQLNEIDKMLEKIDVNEDEALDILLDKGAEKVKDKASDIFSNMFNTDCKYKCPDGSTPKVRKSHTPRYNGCGSFGITFELEDLPEMTSCCNKHDICYDSCGTDRDECDDEFKQCLDKMCKELKKDLSKKEYQGCKDMAKLMYTGTVALGCTPYLQGQEDSCICDSDKTSATKSSDTAHGKNTESKQNTQDKARKVNSKENISTKTHTTKSGDSVSKTSKLKKDEL